MGARGARSTRPGPLNVTFRSDAQGKLSVFVCFQASGAAPPFTPQSCSAPRGSPRQDDEFVTTTKGHMLPLVPAREAARLAGWPAGHT